MKKVSDPIHSYMEQNMYRTIYMDVLPILDVNCGWHFAVTTPEFEVRRFLMDFKVELFVLAAIQLEPCL